jgi:hypothetical protein
MLLFDDFISNSLDQDLWEGSCRQERCRIELTEIPSILQLVFPGQAETPTPAGCTGIRSHQEFDSGVFSVKMKVARCEPEAEIVNSFFTYFHNDDPEANNSEIDIEILGSEPEIIYLTVWTHADAESRLQKRVTRIVDLRKGTYKQSILDDNGFFVRHDPFAPPPFPVTGEYDFSFEDYDASKDFYEYSFAWSEDRVACEIMIEGSAYTLWELDIPGTIPRMPSQICSNIWWANVHWNENGDARAPEHEMRHSLDWIKVEEL